MLSARNIARRYSTPSHYHSTTEFASQRQQKQLARIIRHLKYDLARLYPDEAMPSSWMISCLVASCYEEPIDERNWEEAVIQLLRNIVRNTQTPANITDTFFELDGRTPLFPNPELFGPQHAQRFSCLAESHLKQQLGKQLIA